MSCTGVYWVGPVYDMGGYGNVSRNFLRALEAANIPVYIAKTMDGGHQAEIGEDTVRWLESLSTTAIGDQVVCIRHGVPAHFHLSPPLVRVIKTIGITLFETDRVPADWPAKCNLLDEIWVPSKFNYDTFSRSGVDAAKLRVVPYPIDVTRFYPGRPYNQVVWHPPLRAFSFLYVFGFDFRKGVDLLVQAFCSEFGRDEEVSLVLKIYVHSGYEPAYVMSVIRSYVPADRLFTQIFVIVEPFGEQQLIDLYSSCDAYVSVDRAGWGMPAMEMMALGKPAIGLNWGGYTEFMNAENSILIEPEPELVPVDAKLQSERPDYYRDHRWADIRADKVGKAMRNLYEDRAKRERIGKKAAFDVHFEFSPAVIGSRIKRLLGVR
ncbi:glycosyltransferase family 4 protein [Paenibacillaceae bacterium WGS1546]|uniref:glycosyltransferase family 4 protein n=1 Tax=Cohnella sp. WGS1546 TaxID=3366810 RepID=UPI00372D6EDF